MGIDPTPFSSHLFLYTDENEYMSEFISNDKVKACPHFGTLSGVSVFIDAYRGIYLPELQLKVEHSATHATFLNLETVKDGVFDYKLFDKHDAFPFLSSACLTLIIHL